MQRKLIFIDLSFRHIKFNLFFENIFHGTAISVYEVIKEDFLSRINKEKILKKTENSVVNTIASLLKYSVYKLLEFNNQSNSKFDAILKIEISRDHTKLKKLKLSRHITALTDSLLKHGVIEYSAKGYFNRKYKSLSRKGHIVYRLNNLNAIPALVELRYEELYFALKKEKNRNRKDSHLIVIRETKNEDFIINIDNESLEDKNTVVHRSNKVKFVDKDISKCKDQKLICALNNKAIKIENHIRSYNYFIPFPNINFEGNEKELEQIFTCNDRLSPDEIKLNRIFHYDLDHFGRYYGKPLCYIPKIYRKKIEIDGYKTIQIDFKSCMPSILHIKSGEKLLPNYDFYKIDNLALEREYIKFAFLFMLAAPSRERASVAMKYKFKELNKEENEKKAFTDKASIENYIDVIHAQYPNLSGCFFNPNSYKSAIKTESDIITDIYMRSINRKLAVFDIFDCIMCMEKDHEEMISIINKSCIKILGQKLNIDFE